MAETSDPEKAFEPCQEGRVFGIEYDSKQFTWWLREDKLGNILRDFSKLIEMNTHTVRFMKSIASKIVDIRLMVPNGKFNVGQIIKYARGNSDDMDMEVEVSDWCRTEAFLWHTMLPFCGKRVALPHPDKSLPPWAVQVFTDSAGGSLSTVGASMGAVIYPHWWTYLKWGIEINSGKKPSDGKKKFATRCLL